MTQKDGDPATLLRPLVLFQNALSKANNIAVSSSHCAPEQLTKGPVKTWLFTFVVLRQLSHSESLLTPR
jgi:hypothetical protein